METLRNLWERIPNNWKLWGLFFIVGLIITLVCGVGTLLVVLFLLFFLSYLIFNLFGDRQARVIGQWSITQFFKRIRGILLFALLPTLWELIKKPSLESIISICLLLFVALSISNKFDEIIGNVRGQYFGKRKRRR